MTKGKKKYEDIMYQQSKVTMKHISSTNPFDYIDRFCSNIGLDLNIKYICQFIVFNAIRLDIFDDNTPPSIAAGAIFMVTNVLKMRISKVQVHAATKISEVTISKCFKKLNGFREILFPSQAIKQYNIRFDKNDDIKTYKKKVGKPVEGKVSI
jgi:transcription initiation factor TFIIIB Brf1 subunit/transcription initiation factor TFIIB